MDNEASQQVVDFLAQLVRLNGTMKELFSSGNVALFTEMNQTIKQMHDLQHEAMTKFCRRSIRNASSSMRTLT